MSLERRDGLIIRAYHESSNSIIPSMPLNLPTLDVCAVCARDILRMSIIRRHKYCIYVSANEYLIS